MGTYRINQTADARAFWEMGAQKVGLRLARGAIRGKSVNRDRTVFRSVPHRSERRIDRDKWPLSEEIKVSQVARLTQGISWDETAFSDLSTFVLNFDSSWSWHCTHRIIKAQMRELQINTALQSFFNSMLKFVDPSSPHSLLGSKFKILISMVIHFDHISDEFIHDRATWQFPITQPHKRHNSARKLITFVVFLDEKFRWVRRTHSADKIKSTTRKRM